MQIMKDAARSRGWRTEAAAVLWLVASVAAGFFRGRGDVDLAESLDAAAQVLAPAAVVFAGARARAAHDAVTTAGE